MLTLEPILRLLSIIKIGTCIINTLQLGIQSPRQMFAQSRGFTERQNFDDVSGLACSSSLISRGPSAIRRMPHNAHRRHLELSSERKLNPLLTETRLINFTDKAIILRANSLCFNQKSFLFIPDTYKLILIQICRVHVRTLTRR